MTFRLLGGLATPSPPLAREVVGGASRGFSTPFNQGDASLHARRVCSDDIFSRASRISAYDAKSTVVLYDVLGTEWSNTESNDKMVRVFPVPGGP